jgi:tRNA A37 methylthiotransferase MiaB
MDISQERLRARLGREFRVLVDAALAPGERPRRDLVSVGRFYGQAYDVDGVTYLGGSTAAPGAFVRARIVETQAYDLIAEVSPR